MLSYRQQIDLHSYYQPGLGLTDADLKQHQDRVAQKDRSLPQRTGKSFELSRRVFQLAAEMTAGDERLFRDVISRYVSQHGKGSSVQLPAKGGRQRTITVMPVARPEPDLDQVVLAVLQMIDEDNA